MAAGAARVLPMAKAAMAAMTFWNCMLIDVCRFWESFEVLLMKAVWSR